jgi:tetratricopeptide (TPR) repeat protein
MTPANPSSSKIGDLFDQGFAFHLQGRLDDAERLYKKVLLSKPGHADALGMLGAIALVTDRPQRAVELISKALRIDPGKAAAHSNLAYGQLQLGRADEALASCDAALALQPDFPDACNNRGNALRALRRLQEALAAFDTAIAQRPDFADAHNSRGTTLLELERPLEALASYDAAVRCNPHDAGAHKNRGIALTTLGRPQEALASFNRSLELAADQADVLDSRGNLLCALKRPAEALASYDRAIRLRPDEAVLYNNRGNALTYLQRPEAALADYRAALALCPDDVNALNNLANALNELDRPQEALAAYDAALAVEPGHATTLWHKSLTLLALGRFEEGWPLYETRKATPEASGAAFGEHPPWLGDHDLAGKTLLVHAEQGLGDTLQFSRYAPLVRPRCGRLILRVPPAVERLIAAANPGIEVIGDDRPAPAFDYHCPMMSLPLALGTTLATIPAPLRYLRADPDIVARWSDRLPPRTGPAPRPRIGLAWSGRAAHKNDYNRSIPLRQVLPLLSFDADWVCLQKEVPDADRALLQASAGIAVPGGELADFADTAALVELMDLVITVDTSLAHLAGALGKPVWIMLPGNPDWRWLLGRDDSPWYPSARLFRQRRFADWSTVIDEVQRALPAGR